MASLDIKIRRLPKTDGGRILVFVVRPDQRPRAEQDNDPESEHGWRAIARIMDRRYDRNGRPWPR